MKSSKSRVLPLILPVEANSSPTSVKAGQSWYVLVSPKKGPPPCDPCGSWCMCCAGRFGHGGIVLTQSIVEHLWCCSCPCLAHHRSSCSSSFHDAFFSALTSITVFLPGFVTGCWCLHLLCGSHCLPMLFAPRILCASVPQVVLSILFVV